ncbi:MAG: FAD-dependent oxidoreductase, partial [Acidimicrobiales bacterium]
MSEQNQRANTVVIGAGPAGLTTAFELRKRGKSSVVLEGGNDVGGLSKTCEHRGYRFDIGGHRFFTK